VGENLGLIWEGYFDSQYFQIQKKSDMFVDLKVMDFMNINQCMVL